MRDGKENLTPFNKPAVSDGAEYMHSATSFVSTIFAF